LPGKRNFPADPTQKGAFGEGRYFGWGRLDPDMVFRVTDSALEPRRCSAPKGALHLSLAVP
jgi:hypothetical protein